MMKLFIHTQISTVQLFWNGRNGRNYLSMLGIKLIRYNRKSQEYVYIKGVYQLVIVQNNTIQH